MARLQPVCPATTTETVLLTQPITRCGGDNLGDSDETDLNNNGDGGGVTSSDYVWWKQNYGNNSGGGGVAAANVVPEPSAVWLLMSTGLLMHAIRTRK